jgi:hypothetical protein
MNLTNSVGGAVTDALAGMAAAHPSPGVDVEWPEFTRSGDALVNTPALGWER